MEPILLIHGYSSEGMDNSVEEIYGTLPEELRKLFGKDKIKKLNLSRWISLNDGITLDDVSYSLDRALKSEHPELLESGFHVIIHSTGALVVRNWIKKFSDKPCPIKNLLHLAGANFGSGLAHIGVGQLARWKNKLWQGTGVGMKILHELEFGAWNTLDLHCHFLKPDNDIYHDYQVQEFCIIGSQTNSLLRAVPIRYVKEDSSDSTIRTCASNLNFKYIPVEPKPEPYELDTDTLDHLIEKRLADQRISLEYYAPDFSGLVKNRVTIPFAIAYETAHSGDDIGIVSGVKNRKAVMPLIKTALTTPYDLSAYQKAVKQFAAATNRTFKRVASLKRELFEWNRQSQYEGHAQLIFRIRDQFGKAVENFDVTFQSDRRDRNKHHLEKMIEDHHANKQNKGTITFYFRTQKYNKRRKRWIEMLESIAPVDIEITGLESESDDISYVPLNMRLNGAEVRATMESFKTTVIDITLVRLPSGKVFEIK